MQYAKTLWKNSRSMTVVRSGPDKMSLSDVAGTVGKELDVNIQKGCVC